MELGTHITKRQLKVLANYTKGDMKGKLDNLLTDNEAWTNIVECRYTIMDVIEEYAVDLPFEEFVDMLIPLAPGQYSISSSPLASGHMDVASVTYDVHTAPALSGHGMFERVCSSYLDSRKPGDRLSCFVRATNVNFRLPASSKTPIMIFAAGSGIAPMRAFLQERSAIAEAGSRKLGPALLFFGCRDVETDFLYKSSLHDWEKLGILTVYPAHSRSLESGKPRYVQEAIWEQREQSAQLFQQGGKICL